MTIRAVALDGTRAKTLLVKYIVALSILQDVNSRFTVRIKILHLDEEKLYVS